MSSEQFNQLMGVIRECEALMGALLGVIILIGISIIVALEKR
jgi:hypothetical protein